MKQIRINQMYFEVLPCKSRDGDYWKDVDKGKWEPETFKFMRNYIKPDKDYLEIGGWIGSTAMMAYSLNPRQIYTIEADPANFQTLKYNIYHNHLEDKVKMFNACLTDRDHADRIIPFGTANDKKPNSSSHRLDNGSRILVKTSEVMSFMNKNCDLRSVNCANIDIEGSEVYMTGLLKQLSYRDIAILLSLHPAWWKDLKWSEQGLSNVFARFQTICPFTDNHLPLKTIRDKIYAKEFFPVILKGLQYGMR